MRALSIACGPGDELVPRIVAGAMKTWLRPLQVLMAGPTLLFLTTLTAMLFWNPDVSFHYSNRITFGLLLFTVGGRGGGLKEKVGRFERVSWPMIALTIVVLISRVGKPVDEDTW